MVCLNYDAFHHAWVTIEQGFDVREGHGRFKNNLFADNRPPDLLVNVVVKAPNCFPVIGEIQLHLHSILLLKEVRTAHASRP